MLYDPHPRWLQGWLARRTDASLGVSRSMRDWSIEAFGMEPGRATTLYNGVELDRFIGVSKGVRQAVRRELGLDSGTPVAAVVGRLTTRPDKGQRLAIEAFHAVRRERPDAVLLIVGDGPARAECESHADSLGISDAVRFLGHRSDVERILAAVDVAVVPSVVDEAFCYSALEAIASGRPVVAFDGGGVPELVIDGETGVLVRTGDVDGLATGISRLLANRVLRGRLGSNGRAHAMQFGIPRHVERLEALYQTLVAA
jgi:glycosyltransferase involved in cell wall biosynthesis